MLQSVCIILCIDNHFPQEETDMRFKLENNKFDKNTLRKMEECIAVDMEEFQNHLPGGKK